MKTVFLGTIYPKERLEEIRENSLLGIDNASDNLQWALIEGLDHFIENLTIVSLPFIRNYPKGYKKMIFKSSFFNHKPGAKDICVGFINLVGIYSLHRYLASYRALKSLLSKKESTIIIIYAAHAPFLKAVSKLKSKGYLIKTCLIVPDLPIFLLEQKTNKILKRLKEIDNNIIEKSRQDIDSYVILSDLVKEKFNLYGKPFIRIEGVYNGDRIKETIAKEKYKTILYTGKMSNNEGIPQLLEAFHNIKSTDYRLWIRGFGTMKNTVLLAAEKDSRIKYIEEMSREDLLKLQKMATVLINPTPSSAIGAKYFFPSKTMDYLASGTPTIMCKLECLPKEYHKHIFFIEDESVSGMKEKLIEVCELSEEKRYDFGASASKFILENKNPINQVRGLINMLNEI
jgi:glycosyltransferase involved in cell wall biosynthesis